jgi:hypothetical protein
VRLLHVDATTLARYGKVFGHLRQYKTSLLEAILDTSWRLPAAPRTYNTTQEWLMIVGIPNEEGPSLEGVSDELGTLLAAAQQDIACSELGDLAVRLGAEPAETADLIAGFLTDRLLIRVEGGRATLP